MGWSDQNVIARLVIVEGPGEGIFSYSPSPGAGNLVASTGIATGGTDRFGNVYLQGDTVYSQQGPSSWVAEQIWDAATSWWTATSEAGPWTQVTQIGLFQPSGDTTGGSFATVEHLTSAVPAGFAIGSGPQEFWLIPSNDNTGATDTIALNKIFGTYSPLVGPVTIHLTPGTYWLNATVTLGADRYLTGAGKNATTVRWIGTGDCFRQTSVSPAALGGGITNLTIDGSSSGAGSTGIHAGDIHSLNYNESLVQNFSGAADIGYHFDNTVAFTEGLRGSLEAKNCTQHVVFDVSGAVTSTGSFGYANLEILILALANQDGVVIQNGAIVYHSTVRIRGDFPGSASAVTNAVLRITGSIPAGHTGGNSTLHGSHLEILAECTPGGANTPQTIVFGTLGSNNLVGCEGILDFIDGASAFTVTNYTPTGAPGTFLFEGIVRGDGNLAPIASALGTATAPVTAGPKQYARSLAQSGGASNGTMFVNSGDFFRMQLVSNTTISLNPGGAACLPGPQRKTIVLQQQGGAGGLTVTWPTSMAPTTSAPSVVWAGGAAPVMTAAANAVDVYKLETIDGATWFGQAIQNVS